MNGDGLTAGIGRRTTNDKTVAPRQVKAARAGRSPNCYDAGVALFHLPCFPW